jgi:hypothetical protein
MNAPFHPDREHFEAAREHQERIQRELESHGIGQLPGPVMGEKFYRYRRTTAEVLQRQLPTGGRS